MTAPFQTYYGPPPPQWAPRPVPLSPDGRPLADFGSRLLAYLIDSALLGAVATVLTLPFVVFLSAHTQDVVEKYGAYSDSQPDFPMDMVWEMFWPFLVFQVALVVFLLVTYYVYNVEMMYRSGRTLGKKWIRIQVIPLAPGARLTRGQATKRYLVEFGAGSFIPGFSYLDGFWQLWDKPFQQTLHDKAAGTIVIKVAP